MTIITCVGCGTRYKREEFSIMFRDKDVYKCEECGAVIERMNGAAILKFTKVEEKRKDEI